jgi:hypothetical protein
MNIQKDLIISDNMKISCENTYYSDKNNSFIKCCHLGDSHKNKMIYRNGKKVIIRVCKLCNCNGFMPNNAWYLTI